MKTEEFWETFYMEGEDEDTIRLLNTDEFDDTDIIKLLYHNPEWLVDGYYRKLGQALTDLVKKRLYGST
jgi:hypothetical protein